MYAAYVYTYTQTHAHTPVRYTSADAVMEDPRAFFHWFFQQQQGWWDGIVPTSFTLNCPQFTLNCPQFTLCSSQFMLYNSLFTVYTRAQLCPPPVPLYP